VLLELVQTDVIVKEIVRESEESLPISCNVRYIPPVWTDRQTDRGVKRVACVLSKTRVLQCSVITKWPCFLDTRFIMKKRLIDETIIL
jgi:hypothetical protein